MRITIDTDTGTLSAGDLEIDLQRQTVRRRGRYLELNSLQFRIVKTLALASPGIVSRETLEASIWPDDTPQNGALRMQIHRLRSIADEGFERSLIETVRGHGFRLGI